MGNGVTNERLPEVSDGKEVLTTDELIAIRGRGGPRVQQLIASAIAMKTLMHGGHSDRSYRETDRGPDDR